MPRVLITGAAGFIGMHSCIKFLIEGWEVIGLDNMNDYYSVKLKEDRLKEIKKHETIPDSFVLYREDLNSDVWEEFEVFKFDAVIHLAAQAGVRYSIENPRAYIESNILGFQSVLEFVEKHSISRFVYASSSSVYGKNSKQPYSESEPCNSPESYYAATKIANELMANAYFKTKAITSVGLRFFTVYGPWGRPDMAPMIFTKSAFEQRAIKVFNHGRQKRDFTFVSDVADSIYRIIVLPKLLNKAHVYNVGKGSPINLLDFIGEIETQENLRIKKEFIEAQRGDVDVTNADTELLKNLINFCPEISLNVGMKKFLSWYKSYYKI